MTKKEVKKEAPLDLDDCGDTPQEKLEKLAKEIADFSKTRK